MHPRVSTLTHQCYPGRHERLMSDSEKRYIISTLEKGTTPDILGVLAAICDNNVHT